MSPSVPVPEPDPAIPPAPSTRTADGTMPSGEHEVMVILPDEPPVITPPVAAALLRLLHNAQRHLHDDGTTDPSERKAA